MPPSITIRFATITDLPTLMTLIEAKADFDRSLGEFSGVLHATVEKLQRSLFGETPFARVLFVEQSDQVVGFALYYFRYSSFQARPNLWLDDLYLLPAVRHQGIGTELMTHLARIAQQVNCTHIAWTASVNNASGIRFYEKIGGVVLEQRQDLLYFQLNEVSMRSLTQQGAIAVS